MCWAIPWLCKYLLSLDHNRGILVWEWTLIFGIYHLIDSCGMSMAVSMLWSISRVQSRLCGANIYLAILTVCISAHTFLPFPCTWPFFSLGPTAHIIQPDTCSGGASFWKAHTTCQWDQPSPSAPPSSLHQLHYWTVLLLHWAVRGTVHPGHCHHCRGW